MGARARSLPLVAVLLIALLLSVAPAGASVVVPIADDDLIVHADVIVLGRVTRIESHRDLTDNITTHVSVAVDEVLKGLLAETEITIRELGGKVGDRYAWVFASPHFQVGERVLLFMDQAPDGTLRTYHFFQGKFTIVTDPASGDLVAARGLPRNVTVLPPPGAAGARLPTASVGRGLDDFTRRIREKAGEPRPLAPARPRPAMPFASAAVPPTGTVETHQEFRFLGDPDPGAGTPDPTETLLRWNEPDTNQPVTMRMYSPGEPLASSQGYDQIRAAMRVWSRVPTTAFRFAEGPLITTAGLGGFLANGVNSIAFRDPLGQIAPPTVIGPGSCGGTLAIAGISSASGPITVVNGRSFARALEGDLVVADGWNTCGFYYQDDENFAEVMTHELGHVLGLGHSADTSADATNLGAGRSGATMRPVAAFDGRSAALHRDDRDGVTFIYPGKTLSVTLTGAGTGTVTSGTDGISCATPSPGTGDCIAGFAPGRTVTLTGIPGGASTFTGFTEPECAGGSVMMPAIGSPVTSVTCTAMFTTDPDLSMTAVAIPTTATPGTMIAVNNTVRNGGLDAGPFSVGIYLSSNSSVTTTSQLLGARTLAGGLAFNQTSADATSVLIPADTPPGTYFIGAIADYLDEVAEALETNNVRVATGSIVIARSDLVVTALTAPTTAGTGLTIVANATVGNPAAASITAGPSTLAFYLSSDTTRDGGDRRLAETRIIPSLIRNATSAGATTLTIPPDLAPGDYFLIAMADDLNVVDEQDEGNNTRATATRITVRRPDLTVTSVTAPAVTGSGMNVSLTHIVRNAGTAPATAGASTSRLFLSSDNALDSGSDVDLGTVAVAALAAQAQATVTRSVQIPPATPPGLYWIFAQANALNTVIETDSPAQANNVKGTATAILVGPDLLVTAATPTPTSTAPGLVVNLTNTVRNQGGAAAGAFVVGIYLSGNNSFDASDILVATRAVPGGLAPAATSTAVTPVTIPAGTAAGAYFLIARADDGLQVTEASESNNLLASVAIQVVKADLTVTSVTTTPAVILAGANVSITHVVRNAAAAAGGAPASVSRLFLSTDPALDGGDVQLGADVPVGALAGGAQASLVRSVQIPGGTAAGLYWIIAQANATNTVHEVDSPAQANNVRATATPITVGPDLVISAATVASTATAPGLGINVNNTARNQGAQAAGPFDVTIYLSADNQYTPGVDLPLATRRVAAGVAPGTMSAAMTTVVIPANQSAGNQFLIVRADSGDEVPEGSENNNVAAIALNVVRADLVVSAVTAPAVAAPGMNISVTHTVRNLALAAGGAPATVTRLSLSTDPTPGGDTTLLDVPVGPIAGGGSLTLVRSVALPGGLAPGRYWVVAEANVTGTVIEANAANNTRVTATPIIVGPDLLVSAGSVTPVSVAPGQAVNVASTVRNQGGQAAGVFTVAFFLSTDATFDSGVDTPLGTRQVPGGLAALAMSAATTPLVIPAGPAGGSYFIIVRADSGDAVGEADESNNLRAIPLTLVRPDLTVPSVTVTPGAVAAGANVSVTHVVRNIAAAAGVAGPSTSRLYLSADTTLDGGDAALLEVAAGTLAGMAQASLVRGVQIPPATTPGLYWIIAEANALDSVVEVDAATQTNNVGRIATPLIVGPDLVVSAATATPTATAPGLTVNLNHTVRNQGGAAAGPFTVGVYLSSDNVFDLATDVLLANRSVATPLAPAAMSTATTPVVIPGGLAAGGYFLIVRADIGGPTPPNDVLEADESNDTRAVPISVVRPDLTVLSITAPATGAAGANVSVTYVVRNPAAAAGAAPASVSRLFLSADSTLDGGDVQLGADVPVGALAGMAQATLTRSVQIPAGTAPGLYFIFAQADTTGLVTETNEGNNTLSRPIVIGPDVTLTAVSTVTGAIPGATVNVAYTLRNLGGAASGPFNVAFVLVPESPAGPDIPMGPTRTGVVLAAGGTLVSSTPVQIPGGAPAGTYRVRIVTDAAGAVTEAVESNNAVVTGILTVRPPDLFLSSVTVPEYGVAGRTMGIPNTVFNTALAPGTAPAFQVGLYLGDSADIDTAVDTLLIARALTSLGPSVTSTATTTVTLPTATGSYFIGAVADRAGVVIESNETNNVQAGPITIVPEMLRNRAATATVTLSSCTLPINNGSTPLSGRLVISSHTGQAWSGSVSLPSNAITLTGGTVDAAGNVSGSFTVVNAGGARGAGTFTGTVVPTPGGALSATFTGTFNQGETCTISASLSAP